MTYGAVCVERFLHTAAVCQWILATSGQTTRALAKQATREALVVAALADFVAHGLGVPSLDAICARAGYTRGAFYVHFRDRDDLLTAVVEHVLGAFIDTVISTGDDAHDLERTVGRFADAVRAALEAPAADPNLPLPPAVPFARLLDAITRSRSSAIASRPS